MSRLAILGVTGSIAAYRAADVARELMRAGFEVRVCLSHAALHFVTPALFEGLTGHPCVTHAFDEPERGRMAHIDWAREANVLVVCPATANAIAHLAEGKGLDMFTTLALATDAPLVICPAMNPHMYAHPATQASLQTLRERGAYIVEPQEGDVACGEYGEGKLATTERIVRETLEAATSSELYRGLTVVITAGPTYEPIDPVRYIANRSSGKMGYALADAARRMAAEVRLVSGPTHLRAHPSISVERVTTAEEMLAATLEAAAAANLLIGAAAVADFKPANPSKEKIRRESDLTLSLVPNPDILATVAAQRPELTIVGFAAEAGLDENSARNKMEAKGLAAIFLNDVSRPDVGFDSDENEGVLLLRGGESVRFEKAPKSRIAWKLLEQVRRLL